jgi:energy-converting hydrogenase B subunit Q
MLAITIISEPHILGDISDTIEKHANITYMQQIVEEDKSRIYIEIDKVVDLDVLLDDIRSLSGVHMVETHSPFSNIFGSRIIIIGGGAQVAQVALGAISEADRHNIRGERISVDTIPLIGEESIADAVNAIGRLHRASVLILAGSLMGGSISDEVERLRMMGIPVIALNMAGSVPEHADLVVTDPVQAGTFAAMHIAKTAEFDINRVKGKIF